MKNWKGEGRTLTIMAATAAITGGAGVLQGAIFGVAAHDIAIGGSGYLELTGNYALPKAAAQAWTLGVKVYWDATNSVVTTTASGNTLIGVAAVAAASADTVGEVRLNGVAA